MVNRRAFLLLDAEVVVEEAELRQLGRVGGEGVEDLGLEVALGRGVEQVEEPAGSRPRRRRFGRRRFAEQLKRQDNSRDGTRMVNCTTFGLVLDPRTRYSMGELVHACLIG